MVLSSIGIWIEIFELYSKEVMELHKTDVFRPELYG